MLTRLVFSVTYECPVTCKYCVTESGPGCGPHLQADFMKRAIDEAAKLGQLCSVVFTGGEALVRLDDVDEAVRFASTRNLWTRVVSNAVWATSREKATKIRARLKDSGLGKINFSCDDLHQENIPLERVKHAFWAARDLQIPTLIAHKRVKSEKITINFLSEYLGISLQEHVPGEKTCNLDMYCSGYTIPIGYGAAWLNEEDYILYPKCDAGWKTPCSGVLSSLIVSPTREIRLCCGMINQGVPELSLGSWDSAPLRELVLPANADLITNWLALEGPYGIMQFIRKKDPDIRFRRRYVNHCHLCNDILTRTDTRSVLRAHASEKSAELSLRRAMLEAVRFQDGDATNCSVETAGLA